MAAARRRAAAQRGHCAGHVGAGQSTQPMTPVFARAGFAATAMDDVAAEAGVSELVIYRHFRSKRDLYLAVLGQVRSRLDALAQPRPPAGAPEQALAATAARLLGTLRVARAVPDAFRLLHRHAAHEPAVRASTARVVETTADQAILAWLDVGDPARNPEVADRLARMLAAIVGSVAWPGPAPGQPSSAR